MLHFITYVGIKEDIDGHSNNNLDNPIIFNNLEIEINNRKFNILGNVEDLNNILNNKEVVFRLIDIKDYKSKNISCSSNHQDKENYNCIINCNPDQSIIANLNGAIGYPNNTNKVIIILLSNETQGLIDIFVPNDYIYNYTSSYRISKGALAGIIIPLGLALIASLIIAISCKKQSRPKYEEDKKNQSDLVNLPPNMSSNKTELIFKN